MRDAKASQPIRIQCAIAAAPYCHPKLTSIDVRAYAALNATTTYTTLDAMQLTADQRNAVKALILAASNDSELIEGEFTSDD